MEPLVVFQVVGNTAPNSTWRWQRNSGIFFWGVSSNGNDYYSTMVTGNCAS